MKSWNLSWNLEIFPEIRKSLAKSQDFEISYGIFSVINPSVRPDLKTTLMLNFLQTASAPPTQETADLSSPKEEQEKGPLVVIPYVAGMSEDIRRVCRIFLWPLLLHKPVSIQNKQNGEDRVSKKWAWRYHKPNSWTSPFAHCSHHNLNVSIRLPVIR